MHLRRLLENLGIGTRRANRRPTNVYRLSCEPLEERALLSHGSAVAAAVVPPPAAVIQMTAALPADGAVKHAAQELFHRYPILPTGSPPAPDTGLCVEQPTVPVLPPMTSPTPTATFTDPGIIVLV